MEASVVAQPLTESQYASCFERFLEGCTNDYEMMISLATQALGQRASEVQVLGQAPSIGCCWNESGLNQHDT
eukprot:scaffold681817_cov46-Prasinocladus_malaysianus.AAC.1